MKTEGDFVEVICSLVAAFLLLLTMAYMENRKLGGKMGKTTTDMENT